MTLLQRNSDNGIAGIAYNNLGQRSSVGSGSWTYYGYDAVGRLNGLTQDIPGLSYDTTYGFGYNPASQMTTRSTFNDGYVSTK